MLGGVFPVIVDQMFHRMTFAGASSFLGAVGAVLTLIPYALVFYGPRIRARSKFASVGKLLMGNLGLLLINWLRRKS